MATLPISPCHRPHRQRGSMAVTMLMLMLGLITMLGLVEVGYLYWAKREAQKVADLAALSGAQQLDLCSPGPNSAATSNATQNGFTAGTVTVTCGVFDPSSTAAHHFTANATPANAVEVVASYSSVPAILGIDKDFPSLSQTAIARKSEPLVAATIGTQLLSISGGAPLQTLLKLLGIDLTGTTLAGYQGLVNLHLTPAGLLQALGIPVSADISVGDLNALLAAQHISVGNLLDAYASLASQQGLAGIDLSLLGGALTTGKISLSDLDIQLGSNDPNNPGLFAQIQAPDGQSALNIQVSALDLLGAAISVADGKHALDTALGIPGISVQASVIEPPSTLIGPVGATAFTSQVRLRLNIDSDDLPVVGAITSLLGITLNATVYVDVIAGQATVTKIDCGTDPKTASFDVDSKIANICVGNSTADWASTREVCDASNLTKQQILTLFHAPILTTSLSVPALEDTEPLTIAEGATGTTPPNKLLIGNTLTNLVDQLLDNVIGNLLNPPPTGSSQGNNSAAIAAQIAQTYLQDTVQSDGRYDVNAVINLLENGSTADDLNPLGDWTVTQGVPYACGLNLFTCWKDGSVWDGYLSSVTGAGQGLVGGLLGTLLGGLVLNNCNGLVNQLLNYNGCVQNNLTSYLQTAPAGILTSNPGSVIDNGATPSNCSNLLCAILEPVVNALSPLLNTVGTILSDTLSSLLGINIGTTDVHVQSIQCHPVELVY